MPDTTIQNPFAEPFKLRLLEAQTSQAAGRLILNDNFKLLRQVIQDLIDRPALLATLGDVVVPARPKPGAAYVLAFDGGKYRLRDSSAGTYGIPNVIAIADTILVKPDFQYLVQGTLTILGTLVVEGEVVLI